MILPASRFRHLVQPGIFAAFGHRDYLGLLVGVRFTCALLGWTRREVFLLRDFFDGVVFAATRVASGATSGGTLDGRPDSGQRNFPRQLLAQEQIFGGQRSAIPQKSSTEAESVSNDNL